MKKTRTIYDSDYYRMQLLIQSHDFVNRTEKMMNNFKKIGYPLPRGGFNTYKEYLDWNEKYFLKRQEIANSKELSDKIEKIKNGEETVGPEKYYQIEALRKKHIPPLIEEYISDILNNAGINRKSKKYESYQRFLIFNIFLNKEKFSNPPLIIKRIRNKDTDTLDLFIQILPYTRKEDIVNAWPFIKQHQKLLSEYKERIKEYKKFQRDLDIYNIYQKFKNEPRIALQNSADNRIDSRTWNKIKDKYGDLSWENIRKIVSNIENLIKNVTDRESY